MNFLNIWEKILNFAQVGLKFISFGNKEPQRVFAQRRLHRFYFVQQLQIWVTLSGLFSSCLRCRQLLVFLQFAVGFLWMEKRGEKRKKEKDASFVTSQVQDSRLMSSLDLSICSFNCGSLQKERASILVFITMARRHGLVTPVLQTLQKHPHRQEGKAVLAGVIMTAWRDSPWMLCNVWLRKLIITGCLCSCKYLTRNATCFVERLANYTCFSL